MKQFYIYCMMNVIEKMYRLINNAKYAYNNQSISVFRLNCVFFKALPSVISNGFFYLKINKKSRQIPGYLSYRKNAPRRGSTRLHW
jgi:hypothetical protein